ncbi:MAG: formylglycine-generating enzyme family protein [Candidatus Erginobacter occultus]|nr:formylglycine-generating enzyme family protein [Candidatus Erginobacter occultus]
MLAVDREQKLYATTRREIESLKRKTDYQSNLYRAEYFERNRDWPAAAAAAEAAINSGWEENSAAGAILERSRKQLGPQRGEAIILDLSAGVKMELVWIEAGDFLMGSADGEKGRYPDEGPQHRVEISRGFWMGKHEVTQEQYQEIMKSNPSDFQGGNLPVERVSWDNALLFCENLNQSPPAETPEGYKFRLPTEAEWEYACRADSQTEYHFGSDRGQLDDYAWSSANSRSKANPVGHKKPNAWGLHDMHGNVWEWCRDWYDSGYYNADSSPDPSGPPPSSSRVLRGGSWLNGPRDLRSANRDCVRSGSQASDFGFRVVLAER